MPRYFLEVAYLGTNYSGFQIQQNANSIQAEIEKALKIYYRKSITLTGSSRTDAGVHALQNFFHFDVDEVLSNGTYNLNAILPNDVVVKKMIPVNDDLHCRFNALSREYCYNIYQQKNPFLLQSAYFFPQKIDFNALQEAAKELKNHTDFASFCKKNSQAKTTQCSIISTEWELNYNGVLIYTVKANRFLRGMVRGLVGTMLQVGTGKISIDQFIQIINSKDCTKADFSVPPHGLFLHRVEFPHFI